MAPRLERALTAHAAGAPARARDLARRAALAAESRESAVAASWALFAFADVDSALDVLDSCESPGDLGCSDRPRRVAYRIMFGRAYEALERYPRAMLGPDDDARAGLHGGPELEPGALDARAASRRLLDSISVRPAAEIRADFDALVDRHRDTGLPLAHRAELNMWLGDYEAARADFDAAIAAFPRTRWAYIGLATLESIGGEHARALDTIALGIDRMHNTIGPGVYGVRGEAHRRLGRVDDAIGDLETATTMNPGRISAWINLALAYEALGRHSEALRLVAEIRSRAYPLLHDAARTFGTWLGEMPEPWPVLERSLDLMLGNRASGQITWRVERSPIRSLWSSRPIEAEVTAARAHELKVLRAVLSAAGRAVQRDGTHG